MLKPLCFAPDVSLLFGFSFELNPMSYELKAKSYQLRATGFQLKEMEMGFAFENLEVYQRALDFAVAVIDVVDQLDTPKKHYRLIDQLESSSTSLALNICPLNKRVFSQSSG